MEKSFSCRDLQIEFGAEVIGNTDVVTGTALNELGLGHDDIDGGAFAAFVADTAQFVIFLSESDLFFGLQNLLTKTGGSGEGGAVFL